MISAGKCFRDRGHLDVAELCEGVYVCCCEGVIPHVGVHGGAVEERPAGVPSSDETSLEGREMICRVMFCGRGFHVVVCEVLHTMSMYVGKQHSFSKGN